MNAAGAPGKVYLVGAGPGDPELLTRKGERVLRTAGAVLYDELANPALLRLAPRRAERCYVGKRAGHHALAQDAIERWMVERARHGATVVRLKGGDPMMFGRGGEEIAALERAGIAWEVVPGVSAGTGVAAAAGIALTRRGVASSVRFVAGHAGLAAEAESAPGSETLVLFMGVSKLDACASELRRQGWAAATPVAIIERGTLPGERRIYGRLDRIAAAARRAAVVAPALVIVGRAAARPRAARAKAAAAAAPQPLPGLIVMAHGSPLRAWQRGVETLARGLAMPGQFTHAAFLAPVRPSLGDAVAAAAAGGVRQLAIVPYFLAPGLHVVRDIPALVEAQRRRFPKLGIVLADCLEGHAALRTAVLARAAEALGEGL